MKLRDTQSFKAAKNMAGLSWLVNGILGTIFGGLAIGSFKRWEEQKRIINPWNVLVTKKLKKTLMRNMKSTKRTNTTKTLGGLSHKAGLLKSSVKETHIIMD